MISLTGTPPVIIHPLGLMRFMLLCSKLHRFYHGILYFVTWQLSWPQAGKMSSNACKLIFIFIIFQFIPDLFLYIIASLTPSLLFISVLLWVGCSSCFGGNFLHAILGITVIECVLFPLWFIHFFHLFFKTSLSSRKTSVTMSKTVFALRMPPKRCIRYSNWWWDVCR